MLAQSWLRVIAGLFVVGLRLNCDVASRQAAGFGRVPPQLPVRGTPNSGRAISDPECPAKCASAHRDVRRECACRPSKFGVFWPLGVRYGGLSERDQKCSPVLRSGGQLFYDCGVVVARKTRLVTQRRIPHPRVHSGCPGSTGSPGFGFDESAVAPVGTSACRTDRRCAREFI